MILFYVADFDEGRRQRGAWRQYLAAGPRREQVASPLFIVSISLLPPAGTADQKEMRPSNLSYLEIICLTDSRRLRLPNTNDGYGQLEKITDNRTAFKPTRTAPVCFVRPPKPRLRREWLRKRHLLRAPAELFERRHQESAKPLGIEMGKRKIIRDQSARFLQACQRCMPHRRARLLHWSCRRRVSRDASRRDHVKQHQFALLAERPRIRLLCSTGQPFRIEEPQAIRF